MIVRALLTLAALLALLPTAAIGQAPPVAPLSAVATLDAGVLRVHWEPPFEQRSVCLFRRRSPVELRTLGCFEGPAGIYAIALDTLAPPLTLRPGDQVEVQIFRADQALIARADAAVAVPALWLPVIVR